MKSIQADNGATYTLTKGEADLHYMLDLARVLRSPSGRGTAPSKPDRSEGDPKLTPRSALPEAVRKRDSLSLESRTKIEASPNKGSDIKESTNGERTSEHSGDTAQH